MVSTKKHINELHAEHQSWVAESSFYSDELNIFLNRLTEVAGKNTKPGISSQVEHFQNQFRIQKEQLDILNHESKVHEQSLADFAREHPVAIDRRLFDNHDRFQEKVTAFKKIYEDLKNEFNRFLSSSM